MNSSLDGNMAEHSLGEFDTNLDGSLLSVEVVHSDALSPARALVTHLRSPAAGRSRVGFLKCAPRTTAEWHDLAASLGCEVVLLPQLWLQKLPPGAAFASITVPRLLDALDALAQSRGEYDVVLLAGLDLLLTRLEPDECVRFWEDIHGRFPHRPRALLLTLPLPFERYGPNLSKWGSFAAQIN